MRIAIIITVFNRVKSTLDCLDCFYISAKNTPKVIYDIFIVDDGSTDSTVCVLKEKYPEINVIVGDGNLFWCRGMRLGWEAAFQNYNYDAYIWLNNDSYLFGNALRETIQTYSSESNYIVSGAFKSGIHNRTTYGGRLRGQVFNIDPTGNFQEIEWMNGNFVLISKNVFEKVGFLDNKFHHAIGDYDYGLRAIKAGAKVYLSKEYVGTCEDRADYMVCYDKKKTLVTRFKNFYSPLGDNPFQRWFFMVRHYSVLKAIKVFFITHLFVLFPSLMYIYYNKKS